MAAVELLSALRRRGRVVPEASETTEEIRELIHHGYRRLYWVHESSVTVLAVIHGARAIANMPSKPWEQSNQ